MALFGLKMIFFLRYANITHFFGLRETRLNGIIYSPYPKVTSDAFGFPVDACLSARQAVFWHQLPKMALFLVSQDAQEVMLVSESVIVSRLD